MHAYTCVGVHMGLHGNIRLPIYMFRRVLARALVRAGASVNLTGLNTA